MVISDSDHNVAFQAVKFQLSGNNSELFHINSVSGEITVNTPGSIDCETRPHFNLTASGHFDLLLNRRLYIEVIQPYETKTETSWHQNNGQIAMTHTIGSFLLIQIDQSPAKLDLFTHLIHDVSYEIISYNVVEPQLKTQASLIINVTDVNDNAPIFNEQMEFYSHPSAPVNSTLGKVVAKDNDYSSINNQIDYFLLNGSFDKFTVDKNSGEIRISDELSREPLREEYSLNILAEDSGNPKKSSQIQVKIKVPFNKPPSLPKRHQFEVAENERIGTIIGSIKAEDEEIATGSDSANSLEYHLTSETGPFVIDKMKGHLKTQQILDAETVNEYKFLVSVIDRGIPEYTVTTSVHVIVKDINDNPPQFNSPFGYKSYILEGFEGVLPIQPELTTSDADIMEENQIVTYSLDESESEGFVIDSKTGDVSVKPGHHLDCEYRSSYLLNITAKNNMQMATSSLEIIVQDLNDHTPEFLGEYEFHVDPKTSVGKVIGQVHAVDRDQSAKNNQFGFFLQNGSWDKFSVDTQTELSVNDYLKLNNNNSNNVLGEQCFIKSKHIGADIVVCRTAMLRERKESTSIVKQWVGDKHKDKHIHIYIRRASTQFPPAIFTHKTLVGPGFIAEDTCPMSCTMELNPKAEDLILAQVDTCVSKNRFKFYKLYGKLKKANLAQNLKLQ
uniref:Cadherin domain-containing protein n=1 Tax=Octopus bimaculoides TaxID=37653 RepID=A0A0L8GR92_OCTBM